jgi:hypothetical protein
LFYQMFDNDLGGSVDRKRIIRKTAFSGRWIVLWLAVAISLVTSGCGNRAPEWKEVLKKERIPSEEPPASPKAANELIVYLDTSGSMAGYVSKDGQTIFGKALRELRYATGTFGGSDVKVVVRRVATNVGPPLTDMELTTASQDQRVYNGGETNLAGAIATFKSGSISQPSPGKSVEAKNEQSESAEPKLPARFNVLVTDGVQSTKKGDSNQDCSAGSDQFCVRQKISELLRDGWGGCVLAIRADFHGKVYSEVSGGAIPYDTKLSDPTSFRPFYLYIFSPDPKALDALISSFKDRLRPLLPNGEPVRELNLSFPYASGFTEFDVSVPKESRNSLQRNKDRGGPLQRFTLRVDVGTEKEGPKTFAILAKVPWSKHALDTASEDQLAQLLTWEVVPVFPESEVRGERYPEIKIVGSQATGSGELTLQATVGFPPGTEVPSWRAYRLAGKLNLNQSSPPWIKAWSTDLDTTREVGNRTFNLETALLGLWNNSRAKDQVLAQAYFRVGP